MEGLIHIYTGDGKGKTTAALGLAIRAKGAGLNVCVAQLFKEEANEVKSLDKLEIKYLQYASKHPFFKKYSKEELKLEEEKCRAFVRDVFNRLNKEGYDLVVIDEVGPALKFKLLDAKELIKLVSARPKQTELVMTGRGFPEEIIRLGDYVTEMKMMNHPFNRGISARKGIEY
ncbi:hypothetical protein AYK26_06615 [Euryarchaeota archaeon SM23-78]|nr:MAG: hypothetical protein AYK26_06615 [Euryarchaeota archaeon SM23-78]MBW3000937.1 cob(I)yrinic acid a,c-diamide adenosyltransferase [Candidatus Woesearchaeota archaeon]